jgi:hypothetical protein
MANPLREQDLIEKIRTLPAEKLGELEDFVDFLRQRTDDRRLTEAVARRSEDALRKVWDNSDDADYDADLILMAR